METLYKEYKYAKVYYNSTTKTGSIIWTGNPTFDEFKLPFKDLLDIAAKEPVLNFISDIRERGAIGVESRKWFETEMIPAARNSGLQRTAIITNADPFKRYYLNMLLLVANKSGVPSKVFTEVEDAAQWLNSFQTAPV